MDSQLLAVILPPVATFLGSIIGILAANKMTNYRIEQLEKKVNKHNNLVERTYALEGQITEVIHDIRDLKEYHKPK